MTQDVHRQQTKNAVEEAPKVLQSLQKAAVAYTLTHFHPEGARKHTEGKSIRTEHTLNFIADITSHFLKIKWFGAISWSFFSSEEVSCF